MACGCQIVDLGVSSVEQFPIMDGELLSLEYSLLLYSFFSWWVILRSNTIQFSPFDPTDKTQSQEPIYPSAILPIVFNHLVIYHLPSLPDHKHVFNKLNHIIAPTSNLLFLCCLPFTSTSTSAQTLSCFALRCLMPISSQMEIQIQAQLHKI